MKREHMTHTCDRCGAETTTGLTGRADGWGRVTAEAGWIPSGGRDWDLCDDCVKAFRAWVEKVAVAE